MSYRIFFLGAEKILVTFALFLNTVAVNEPMLLNILAGFSPSWKKPRFYPITLPTLASKLQLLLSCCTNCSPYLGNKPHATMHNELSWTRVTHLCDHLGSVVKFSLPDFLRKWGLHAHISCQDLCLLKSFVSVGPCNETWQKGLGMWHPFLLGDGASREK